MCKYCRGNEPEAIVSDPYNVLMLRCGELYFLSQEGDDDYELSGKINYCPMCGRPISDAQ